MTIGNQAGRGSGWEAVHRNLAADAVVAETLLYAAGGRRLTVEHGQSRTDQPVPWYGSSSMTSTPR